MKLPMNIGCDEQHHMCRGCIIQLGKGVSSGERLKCPLCRGGTPISHPEPNRRETYNRRRYGARRSFDWPMVLESKHYPHSKVNKHMQRIINSLKAHCASNKCEFKGLSPRPLLSPLSTLLPNHNNNNRMFSKRFGP